MAPKIPTDRQTRALVAFSPATDNTPRLVLETLALRALGPKELLIKIVASGICHTDVHYAGQPSSHGGIYPRVLGHEGAGHVVEIGNDVEVAQPGDVVLLAYPSCGTCTRCRNGNPCFCTTITNQHLAGEEGVFRTVRGEAVYGHFHGQSSFAQYTIVREGAVTNVEHLLRGEAELRLFASLVCGFQTGAGSVMSVAKARNVDSVVVIGCGGVGLGAVVAAKRTGCAPIIAVDLHQARLDAALKLGATIVLRSGSEGFDLEEQIKSVTGGCGASIVLDTTGLVKVIEAGVAAVEDGGKFVHVGLPNPILAEYKISLIDFLAKGKSFMSSKAGDIQPREFIPRMIGWYRDGDMPIDDIVAYYPVEEYEQALHNMKLGKDIKTVLVW